MLGSVEKRQVRTKARGFGLKVEKLMNRLKNCALAIIESDSSPDDSDVLR